MDGYSMESVTKYGATTILGLALGTLAVFWLQPATAGGVAFVVTVCVVFVNGLGSIWRSWFGRSGTPPRKTG